MREGWRLVSLGDVADTRLGKTLPRGSGADVAGLPYLRNVNVQWNRIDVNRLNRMPFSAREQEELSLRKGDLLICEGGEVGRLTILGEDLEGIFFQNALHRVRVLKDDVMPEFVALALEHFVRSGGLEGLVTQVTIAHLNQAKLRALPLRLPPPAEQRRIVDLVCALDDTIAVGRTSYSAAAEARLALCRAAQSTAAPTRIGEIADVSQGKSFPKASQGVTTGDTPWFKIADMAQEHNVHGYVRAETALAASEIVQLGGVILQPGAVVFPRVGAAVLTEKKRLVLVPGAVDENHLVLTPLEGTGSELLLAVMDNLRLSGLVQSGAVPSLNMGLVRATAVQWPTELAAELDSALGDFRRSLEAGATLLQKLRLLRSHLVASLLSGEHVIPDSYDELMGAAS